MAAKIRAEHQRAEVSLVAGGGGDFIVTAEGQVLWDKRNREGTFPDEAQLVAKLATL